MVKNQFGVEIKKIRSDNARDYFNQVLSPFFKEKGIIYESLCTNTPQQNGVAKRKWMAMEKMEDFDFVRKGRMKDQAKTNLYPYLP